MQMSYDLLSEIPEKKIPFVGCNLVFKDDGAFRCKKAYINIYSLNGQKLILSQTRYSTGFNYSQFIPSDFCLKGIEIGYDIAWGTDWPIRHKFEHGKKFQDKIINLNSLYIRISGTCRNSHVEIEDASGNCFEYYP